MTSHTAPRRLRASTVEIPDPGDLVRFLDGPDDVAWLRRGEGTVGLGVALRADVDSMAEGSAWWAGVVETLEHATELPGEWGVGPLAFGSFALDPARSASPSVLVVPRVIVGRRGGRAWLTTVSAEDAPAAVPPPAAPAPGPGAVRLSPAGPDAGEWASRVARAVARINDPQGGLDKVVLARAVRAAGERPIVARHLVDRLAAAYPTCWTFHVDGLVGASPEMLIRVESGLATSRVLAGTIRRGSPGTDEMLAEALSGSGKDLAEHRFAVQSVADALRPFCSGMNTPDAPFVLQLPNVMHLASDVTGVMKREVSSLQLAEALHPSAAVCGTPTPVALAAIAEHEGIDRGRYSGPVGWIDTAGDGEWAIALRCGRLEPDGSAITLYAGCGIVGASQPEAELAETRAKLRPMLDALGAGDDEA